jgi:hypothetical protein
MGLFGVGVLATMIAGPLAASAPTTISHKVPFTVFAVPGSNVTTTGLISMNDAGAVSGSYTESFGAEHGFIRSTDGKFTKFNVPGSLQTRAMAINAGGSIAGYFSIGPNESLGFVRSPDGSITTFGVPGATSTFPIGINASGAVAGIYNDTAGNSFGFLRNVNGNISTFSVLSTAGTTRHAIVYVSAINDSGEITGFASAYSGPQVGFLRNSRGKIQTFDITANYKIYAYGISSAGTVTGYYYYNGVQQGYLRSRNGNITGFEDSKCSSIIASGINRKGQVGGSCLEVVGGRQHSYGFLRSPNGKMRLFQINGNNTGVNGITTAGTVFGTVNTSTGTGYGFFGTP